ncbi:MAG: type I restriction-modification system subunit M N-terminal domain-containing protein [Candidatus Riflebacteria bacterium]|nr:type I restriction-modification system subunit M N-terminal domain-containing protein [Candidatus Riflebacteria bacterium]
MNHIGNNIETRLWDTADELRANSKLKSSEYSVSVLGLVFLRYVDHNFQTAAKELAGTSNGRRKIGPADYQARGVLYLPEMARFSALIALAEGGNNGAAINEVMPAIEADNPDLKDILPKTYNRFKNTPSVNFSDFEPARQFKSLKEKPIVLSSKHSAEIFDQFVSPLSDQTRSLMYNYTLLRRSRDFLLPKPISGEVDVPGLDITTPNEAAS